MKEISSRTFLFDLLLNLISRQIKPKEINAEFITSIKINFDLLPSKKVRSHLL